MSFDQYQFHMVHRQEHMTRAERIAADEQAARIVQALSGLRRAVRRALRPAPRGLAALQPRRNP
jgi:hypothetical protein